MWTIAGLSFREIARKKILIIALILTAVYLSLYGTALHYAHKQISHMPEGLFNAVVVPQLLTAGLFFASMILCLLAIFSAAGAVSGEVEKGLMHAVVARPVKRSEIILGKFIGLGGMLFLYGALLYGAIVLLVYLKTGYRLDQYVRAGLIFLLQPVVLLALGLLGSTLITTLANGIATFILYGMSILGGIVEQVGVIAKSDTLINIGIVSGLLVPVDVVYRKMLAVLMSASSNPLVGFQTLGPFGVQSEPSLWMMLYAVVYCLVMLGAAMRVFGKKDI